MGITRFVHGESGNKNPLYSLWQYIKKIEDSRYKQYNSNNTVCDRWKESYLNFKEDLIEKPSGAVLLLKEDCTEYNKENCYWGSKKDIKKSPLCFLTLKGETKSLIEWAEQLNVKPTLLYKRKELGLSDEEILTKPIRKSPTVVRPGDKFEMITIESFSHKHKQESGKNVNYWNCICDCNNKLQLRGAALRFIKSCGCQGLLNSLATNSMDKYRKEKRIKLHKELLEYIPALSLEESNEKAFRHWLANEIQNKFNVLVKQEIYIKQDEARIDILISELNLGIEVKTNYTSWCALEVNKQIEKYEEILKHPVCLVSPDGKWGMTPIELFNLIKEITNYVPR